MIHEPGPAGDALAARLVCRFTRSGDDRHIAGLDLDDSPLRYHAQGAETVGATLRPTTVLLVGNPQAGTPLIQISQAVGIDLPLRFLIWERRTAPPTSLTRT